MATVLQQVVSRGFVDLPCKVSSHRRWNGEYLVAVKVPDQRGEILLFAPTGKVQVLEGSPDSEGGAQGTLRATVVPEATKVAGGSVVIFLPGDPLSEGHFITLAQEFVARLKFSGD